MEKCKQIYGESMIMSASAEKRLEASSICAENLHGFIFDQGSPLVANGTLYGIAAWNAGFDTATNKDYPDVYINVGHYSKWIQDNVISNE